MNGAGVVIRNSTNISTTGGKYKATSDEVPFHDADGLYAVGPLTRSAYWEALAVPDLRRQADQIAKALARDLTRQAV